MYFKRVLGDGKGNRNVNKENQHKYLISYMCAVSIDKFLNLSLITDMVRILCIPRTNRIIRKNIHLLSKETGLTFANKQSEQSDIKKPAQSRVKLQFSKTFNVETHATSSHCT